METAASFAGGTIGQITTVVAGTYVAWMSFACETARWLRNWPTSRDSKDKAGKDRLTLHHQIFYLDRAIAIC